MSKKVLSDISEENEEHDKTKNIDEESGNSDTEEEIHRDKDDYDEDDDEDEDEDEDEDDEDLENGHISPNDLFDESDVDIQDVLSQFFQNSEGENIPEMMNDLRIAIDNN